VIVINATSPTPMGGNNGVVTVPSYPVSVDQLCRIPEAGCLPLDYNSTTDTRINTVEPIVYFFLVKDINDYTGNPTVKISDVPEGLFVKYSLSNSVDVGEDIAVLDSLQKGDARLTVNYGGKKITNMKDVIGIVYDNGPNAELADADADDWPPQSIAQALSVGGKLGSKDNGIDVPGRFFVKNLQNNKRYWVGVAFLNKWNFSTYISETRNEEPEEIETFLETKACYLISAGFKKEHYVLEYFRSFRDRILLQSKWGKRFVEFYYSTAPKYAQIIWHNELLSGVVRFFAFIAYFLMRYFPAIALLIMAGVLIRKLWPTFR